MYVYPIHLRLSKFPIFHGPIPANINGEYVYWGHFSQRHRGSGASECSCNHTMALNILFWKNVLFLKCQTCCEMSVLALKKQCSMIVIGAFNSLLCSLERPLPELSPVLAITPFSSDKTLDHRNLPSSTLALALPVHSLRGSWQPCQLHL